MNLYAKIAVSALMMIAPAAASASTGQIGNAVLDLRYETPATAGSYRGTRFDWSGMLRSLRIQGHEIYGPWFDHIDPSVYNNEQRARPDGTGEVVTGTVSSGQGPCKEFATDDKALGFDAAAPGGLFLKIGVGVLRRPDSAPYDRYRAYEIVDGGRWTTKATKDGVTFRQILTSPATGYGYVYTKTIRLLKGRPVLVMDHRLRNAGRKPLVTGVYNHNFFATGRSTDAGFKFVAPWPVAADSVTRPDLVRVTSGGARRSSCLRPDGHDRGVAERVRRHLARLCIPGRG